MSIGSKITELRNSKGLTRVQLASELEVPMTTLRNYETDDREPGHKFLVKVANYFGVSTDYILENEKPPASEDAEDLISMEESNRLFDSLVQAGLIDDSIEFSADDRAFLSHVVGLLDVWIRNKRA